MLYIAGMIIAFFLVILLLGKKDKNKADRILAIWLLALGLHLLLVYLASRGDNLRYPFVLGWELPLPLLHGPLLYLYTAALVGRGLPPRRAILHFLPILAAYAMFSSFFVLPEAQRIAIYQQEGAGYESQLVINLLAIFVSGISYTILSFRLLWRHQKRILQQFSYTEKLSLRWLRYVIFSNVIIWTAVVLSNDQVVFSAVVLFILFLGYFGIRQPGIFVQKHLLSLPQEETTPAEDPSSSPEGQENQPAPDPIKYRKSGLSQEAALHLHRALTELMRREALFRDPELSLSELAERLEVHPNSLSQVVNSFEQKNFYDYINAQRVEAFKQSVTLPEKQHYTLLALAYDCGFNSKTSFNRNFKKHSGLTPSDYLKEQHIDLH